MKRSCVRQGRGFKASAVYTSSDFLRVLSGWRSNVSMVERLLIFPRGEAKRKLRDVNANPVIAIASEFSSGILLSSCYIFLCKLRIQFHIKITPPLLF